MEKKVVLVPFPFQGHINPMLHLGAFLHSKGFSITVAHPPSYNSPNTSKHPEFTFIPIPDGLTADEITSRTPLVNVFAINANCEATFKRYLTQVMEQQPQNKISCIIYDEFMYFSEAVANYLNIPSIILRTQTATNISARKALLELHSKGYNPFADSMLQKTVPGLHPLRFKDLPNFTFETLDNYTKLLGNALKVRTSSAIIWNTLDCLEQSSLAQVQEQCQVPNFPIGPLHKIITTASSSFLEEDTECIAWLDKQCDKSVIYISFGSVAFVSEKELPEMAWGLANSEQPFLWVIRPGSIPGSDWIELLPQGFIEATNERGRIVQWAPQREVLAHPAVGGFWSHSGWNSTLESMSEGVPLICRPCFCDQTVHARYASQVWKIGLQLENELERGEVERAVRKLMVDDNGKEMRLRALELKKKIEISLKGGTTFHSLNALIDLIKSF